ncbi:MAG: hypothetical protein AAFZ15_26540 [Bacteroidota bacterium]
MQKSNILLLCTLVLFSILGCNEEDLSPKEISAEKKVGIDCTRSVVTSLTDLATYNDPPAFYGKRGGELNRFVTGGICASVPYCPTTSEHETVEFLFSPLDAWCSFIPNGSPGGIPSSFSVAQQDAYIAQAETMARDHIDNLPLCPNGNRKTLLSIEFEIYTALCFCPDYTVEPPHLNNNSLVISAKYACCGTGGHN